MTKVAGTALACAIVVAIAGGAIGYSHLWQEVDRLTRTPASVTAVASPSAAAVTPAATASPLPSPPAVPNPATATTARAPAVAQPVAALTATAPAGPVEAGLYPLPLDAATLAASAYDRQGEPARNPFLDQAQVAKTMEQSRTALDAFRAAAGPLSK